MNDFETAHLNAQSISHTKKLKYLAGFSEAAFRDQVVRPVFERRGLRFVRDTCGPVEEGKDCIFVSVDPLGLKQLYAVQTKRGHLTMSRKPTENLLEALTQIKMALATDVPISDKETVKPSVVVLCASGKISKGARDYIVREERDPRIRIFDANDLIPEIDNLYPEFWFGIDADRFPYLRRLKESLLGSSDIVTVSELQGGSKHYSPVADGTYVSLYLNRVIIERERRRGEVIEKPKFEEIAVQRVFSQTNRLVVIFGEGGAGKTTALRRVAYQWAERGLASAGDVPIPILLRATEISGDSDRLVGLLGRITGRLSPTSRACFAPEDLKFGRVIVLIDALDEVSPGQREAVLNRIAEFHSECPRCFIIVTSRDYGAIRRLPELARYATYNISPLNTRQVKKLVDRVSQGRSLPPEAAREMLRRLQEVHGFQLNPLLVTVFAATTEVSKKDIPPNITEVFKKFTELMLGRWDERKGFGQQYQSPLKDFLLRNIAFVMHRRGHRTMTLAECRRLIAEDLQRRGYQADLEVLFDELIYRSGLLRIDGDVIEFRHHLLQEYFAGRAIPSLDFLASVVVDEWWRKPIVFYFGDRPSAHRELADVIYAMTGQEEVRLYESAITIGLATQACYLVETSEKINALEWVVRTLASSLDAYGARVQADGFDYPLSAFIVSYILARDSVACDQIGRVLARLTEEARGLERPRSSSDGERFWCIVGLIESGQMGEAAAVLAEFKPSDTRLLLALHMSCAMLSMLRIASNDQKKDADRAAAELARRIPSLIQETVKELKSVLVDLHQGTLQAVDAVEQNVLALPDEQLPALLTPDSLDHPAGGSVRHK